MFHSRYYRRACIHSNITLNMGNFSIATTCIQKQQDICAESEVDMKKTKRMTVVYYIMIKGKPKRNNGKYQILKSTHLKIKLHLNKNKCGLQSSRSVTEPILASCMSGPEPTLNQIQYSYLTTRTSNELIDVR